MAKVIAPFKISGTIDDFNFVVTADGNNHVRRKASTGVTSAAFNSNPIFNPIREHGKEWGYCSRKSKSFRQIAHHFFTHAKDGSFAGRSIKLVSQILQEDNSNSKGMKILEEACKSTGVPDILKGFEANRNQPLPKVLKTNWEYNPKINAFSVADLHPEKQLYWPEEYATHVKIQMATAVWDPEKESSVTLYSDCCILERYGRDKVTVQISTDVPQTQHWNIIIVFIGFLEKNGKELKLLHRKYNTASIIACWK